MTILTKAELRDIWDQDKKRDRRRFWRAFTITAVIFLLCVFVKFNAYAYAGKFVPLAYLKSYGLALRLLHARLTGGALWGQKDAAIASFGSVIYYGALAQLRMVLMSFAAGAGLALAGAIFQTAYRNPMASPNIIGASAGVSLGNVVVVMLFSARAYTNILLRYEYCYGFTAICVGLVLLLRKLTGRGHADGAILQMIMAGAIVSQILQVLTQYFMYNLTDENLVLYQQIGFGVYMQTDGISTAIFFGVLIVSIAPILLMRYRFNALSMDRMEEASAGVGAGTLRVVGQVCGVMMVTCAMIHYGVVGMVTLVIPYGLRRMAGSDFRRLSVYSVLAGGSLLMLCRVASSFVAIEGAPIPVAFVAELALMPVFAVILARRRRTVNEA